MGLTPSLKSVGDLLKKSEREADRAYHSHDDIDKFDHFYNFCVSAHSMRDFFFEDKGIVTANDRQPYHDKWNNDEVLRAVGEIANSSKHLVLRQWNGPQKEVKTHGVSTRTNTFVDFYICNGALEKEFVRRREVSVALDDDYEVALYDFTSRVLHRWYRFLESHDMINDDPQLLCRLGGMYNNGWENVPKDHIKAVKYLCRAAEQDNRDAMGNLGAKFNLGDGVLRDRVLALTLYRRANQSRRNSEVSELVSQMDADEIEEAKRRVRDWVPENWGDLKTRVIDKGNDSE